MNERIEAAREQLRTRGYRRNADYSLGKNRVLEQWVHGVGPAVFFLVDGGGWDLYVQADTTNDIAATWDALNARMGEAERIKHHAERTFDCEVWIGALVGTPGKPQSGDRWVPAEYISTNDGGQHYVSARGSGSPMYVSDSAFRRTRKVSEKELKEVGR